MLRAEPEACKWCMSGEDAVLPEMRHGHPQRTLPCHARQLKLAEARQRKLMDKTLIWLEW